MNNNKLIWINKMRYYCEKILREVRNSNLIIDKKWCLD